MSVPHQLLFFFSFVVSKFKENKFILLHLSYRQAIYRPLVIAYDKAEQRTSVHFYPQTSEDRGRHNITPLFQREEGGVCVLLFQKLGRAYGDQFTFTHPNSVVIKKLFALWKGTLPDGGQELRVSSVVL